MPLAWPLLHLPRTRWLSNCPAGAIGLEVPGSTMWQCFLSSPEPEAQRSLRPRRSSAAVGPASR
jgi:hypothetical protein